MVIGGQEIRTGDLGHALMPHDHGHVLADVLKATPQHVEQAIADAAKAQREWARWAWEDGRPSSLAAGNTCYYCPSPDTRFELSLLRPR